MLKIIKNIGRDKKKKKPLGKILVIYNNFFRENFMVFCEKKQCKNEKNDFFIGFYTLPLDEVLTHRFLQPTIVFRSQHV